DWTSPSVPRRMPSPLGQQGARPCDLPGPSRFDERAREPGVHRDSLDLFTNGRHRPAVDRANALEKLDGSRDRLVARFFEPVENAWIAAPGDDIQNRRRQVDARNLRL